MLNNNRNDRILSLDPAALLEGLRKGSAEGAGGSGLFARVLRETSREALLADPFLAGVRDVIARARDGFARAEIPPLPWRLFRRFDEDGDRAAFETPYFERRRRLLTLALAAWLWEEPSDITLLEDCIWEICGEYSWSLPAHMWGTSLDPPAAGAWPDNRTRLDLFSCETGFALAECCAMLEGRLAPLVASHARAEVFRRVLDSYRVEGALWSWETMRNNWCAVTAGSIASAAMYLIEDDTLLAGLLFKLLPVFDRYLDSFSDEGVSEEGLSYWTYGMSFFVSAADLLLLRSGMAINLFDDPRVESIARFPQACYFPGGATLRFSDAAEGTAFRLGLSCYLAEKFPGVRVPSLPYRQCAARDAAEREGPFEGAVLDHCGRFCAGLRDLLWARQDVPLTTDEPRVDAFADSQWLLCAGAGGTGFAAKGGHNAEPHNHNDVGSFIYYQGGQMLLCDLGAGLYTKDYFGPNRYMIFCNSSLSHSVPIVAGAGQKAGRAFCARSCVFPAPGEMTLEMADAYGNEGLLRLERAFRFNVDTGALHIRDLFGFAGAPLAVTERFVTLAEPRQDGMRLRIPGPDGGVTLRGPEGAVPRIGRAVHRTHAGGGEQTVYTIDYEFSPGEAATELEFFVERAETAAAWPGMVPFPVLDKVP
ncbi:MAG: heparinase II/III-family protein [Treponema sp.]|jgi:hypothetical protein|nr:heparinase II/III-family protein [Treponema sp.]